VKIDARKVVETVVLALIAAPVVGLFMGGIYSLPAIRLTRGREPGLSILLSVGLAVTVFGLGYALGVALVFRAGIWLLSIGLLLATRKYVGALDHNLERFGKVHALALLITFLAAVVLKPGFSGSV
jgi:hypothetical protein